MRVTEIKPGKHGLFYVHIDGQFAFSAYDDILYRYAIRAGEDIAEQTLAAAREEQSGLYAKRKALDLLSYGDMSRRALYTKLTQKGIDAEHAAQAVSFAAQQRLVDDERYAEELCRYLFERKKYGVQRVKSILYEKGLDKETADDAVERFEPDPVDILTELLKGERAVYSDDPQLLKKAVDRLMRRGFRYADIRTAIRLVADQYLDE